MLSENFTWIVLIDENAKFCHSQQVCGILQYYLLCLLLLHPVKNMIENMPCVSYMNSISIDLDSRVILINNFVFWPHQAKKCL